MHFCLLQNISNPGCYSEKIIKSESKKAMEMLLIENFIIDLDEEFKIYTELLSELSLERINPMNRQICLE